MRSILFFYFLMASMLFSTVLSADPMNNQGMMNEPLNAPYLQKNPKRYQLVFFGYVGCKKVCTPMLHQLSDFYNSPAFSHLKPVVGVSFVNLIPEMDPKLPPAYARSINPNFVGIHLSDKEIASIDKEFSLFISKRLNEPGEIDHSDHVYLVERNKKGDLILKNIYITHPMNKEKIISDINGILKQ